MGSVTPYQTAKGRRYWVRYRKPDRTEAEKRGFTKIREAELYLSMVTGSKAKGEYIDPVSSRVPVRMFVDSWLRSKQPPMTKHSYYAALELAWNNHVEPVWADREISSIRRSEVQDWVSELATRKSRTVVIRSLGILAGILDVASMIVGFRTIPLGTSATFQGTVRANVASTSRATKRRRWRHVPRIRRSS